MFKILLNNRIYTVTVQELVKIQAKGIIIIYVID